MSKPFGNFGLVRKGSIAIRVPPGASIRTAAWPSQVILPVKVLRSVIAMLLESVLLLSSGGGEWERGRGGEKNVYAFPPSPTRPLSPSVPKRDDQFTKGTRVLTKPSSPSRSTSSNRFFSGESTSRTPRSCPPSRIGTTISERESASQAM